MHPTHFLLLGNLLEHIYFFSEEDSLLFKQEEQKETKTFTVQEMNFNDIQILKKYFS